MKTLIRYAEDNKTVGILNIDNNTFSTLELKWDNNKRGKSCIEDGIYQYSIDYSNNKKRNVIELLNVKNRTQIQIHTATKTSQLAGCIGLKSREVEDIVFDLLQPVGWSSVIRIKTINKNLKEV